MAMRIISQRPLSYFKSIESQLTDKLSFDDIKKYREMDKNNHPIQIKVILPISNITYTSAYHRTIIGVHSI